MKQDENNKTKRGAVKKKNEGKKSEQKPNRDRKSIQLLRETRKSITAKLNPPIKCSCVLISIKQVH